MAYLKLFHGRKKDEELDDWGENGPIFGPYPYFHTTYATDIKFGDEFNTLYIVDDMVYYDGMYYGDWSVYSGPTLETTDFDPEKAKLP
jgi:hypothetical protein